MRTAIRISVSSLALLCLLSVLPAIGAEGSGKNEGSKKAANKVALGGKCAVCLVEKNKDKDGKAEFTSVYQGFEYRFPGEKQKKMFDANPGKYAIQKGGQCVVCKKNKGVDVKGDPSLFAAHNGKIFIFASEKAKKAFLANPGKFAGAAKKKEEAAKREGS